MRRSCYLIAILLATTSALLLAGCGGMNGSPGTTRFTFTWPAAGDAPGIADLRGAQSLALEVRGPSANTSRVINRPAASANQTATLTFSDLPVGAYTFTVVAYALPNATGTKLAEAAGACEVSLVDPPPIHLAAGEARNVAPTAQHYYLYAPGTRQLVASVLGNAPGTYSDTVLLVPVGTTFTWSSSAPTVATVSPTGLLTAKSPGTAVISVSVVLGGKVITGNPPSEVNVLGYHQ